MTSTLTDMPAIHEPPTPGLRVYAGEQFQAGHLRAALGRMLAGFLDEDAIFTAQLVLDELYINAIAAASRFAQIPVDLHLTGDWLFIQVGDDAVVPAEWMPPRREAGDLAEDGRGLMLAYELAAEITVQRWPTGKTICARLDVRGSR